ncbi:MAG: helix-turn-helix transcriptional regulator [Clostridia bacterium]|nr:helix-turn-helix transcriptional regulator [Clostridia bacterium]
MKLSEKILNLRKARNMSQEELAEKLGVSRQAVSRWEVGSALPDASNILQLSKLFGVSADYLLNDDYKGEAPAPIKSRTVSSVAGTLVNKIISLCAAGFGFAGNFIIYVMSRFIAVDVPHRYYNSETDSYWHTWGDGYSYRYFIEEYRLELLSVIFWLMLIVGLFIAFMPKDKFLSFLGKAKEFIKHKAAKKKSE